MKSTFQIAFILFTLCCFSQSGLSDEEYNRSGAAKILSVQNAKEAESLAKEDLKAKTPFLFIQGEIASVKYPTDDQFKKAYGIYYHDFGCVAIDSKISTAYNNVIFNYLTATYGKKWMKTIRKDVIGLKKFKPGNGS